jgi:CubicO group peptidase (beta-lactamase class C family)
MTSALEADARRFAPVGRVFAELMREADAPLGAAVCGYVEGRRVVDLWAGWQDEARRRPWEGDTLCPTMSATKGIAAVVIHMLVERGLLELEAPVARYWPEFAAEGKGEILIRQVLTHRAGVPMLADDAVGIGGDHLTWVRLIERAPLRTLPDSQCQYHMVIQGYILGELARRVTGQSLGTLLGRWVTGPLHADYFIGLPPGEERRLADLRLTRMTDLAGLAAAAKPGDLLFPVRQLDLRFDSEDFRRGEIPSSNGIGSARGLARIYAALAEGGTLDGVTLMSRETIERAGTLVSDDVEAMTKIAWPLALGFHKDSDFCPLGGSATAFGHPGFGGSIGMCDPAGRLSFAYVQNEPPPMNHLRRASALLTSLLECLG